MITDFDGPKETAGPQVSFADTRPHKARRTPFEIILVDLAGWNLALRVWKNPLRYPWSRRSSIAALSSSFISVRRIGSIYPQGILQVNKYDL